MGGLGFLLKKGWHPGSSENKKAVFMAEQEAKLRAEQEREAAAEVRRERELQQHEKEGDLQRRDPRDAGLKFMYSLPTSKKTGNQREGEECSDEEEEVVVASADPKIYVPAGEEDDDVKKFRAKWAKKNGEVQEEAEDTKVKQCELNERADEREGNIIAQQQDASKLKTDPNFGQSAHYSRLERAVGRKRSLGVTQQELEARHPSLKNAPTEGSYTKTVQVTHKPFGHVVRNVQCFRCGEWGHASGDRECSMANHNPQDWSRREREDPLNFINSTLSNQKQHQQSSRNVNNLIIKESALSRSLIADNFRGRDTSTAVDMATNIDISDDDSGNSDPEAAFLSSLTSKEKVLLLRKLEMIEEAGDDVASYAERLREQKGISSDREGYNPPYYRDSDYITNSQYGEKERKQPRKHKHKNKRKKEDFKKSRK